MRNQDNYINSKQYIIEQLFPYSNADNQSEDFNTLKMKIWVIDGPVRLEEYVNGETPDKDVESPMNHWATLQNDLVYLDRYIRTKDNTLIQDPPEANFDELWEQRIKGKERFLNTEKEPGVFYQDWEQKYNQRPTLLSKDDYEELYQSFKTKETLGEWETSFDITKKITDYVIDIESKQAEDAIESNQTPAEIKTKLDENADDNVNKNDYNYVVEMNKFYDELWDIVQSVKPGEPEEWVLGQLYELGSISFVELEHYKCILEHTSTEDNEPGTGIDWEMHWELMEGVEEIQLILANVPTKRVQIVLIEGHSSHKGPIIESQGTGGYRFQYRMASDGSTISLPVTPPVPPATWSPTLVTDLLGELEDNWNDWVYAQYYEDIEGPKLESLEIDKNSLPTGTSAPGDLTRERFDVLNERWENLNNLREYQVMNNGTRSIIESMVNAEIPDLLPDKIAHFNTRKEQKQNYTNILKERRPEFL